MAVFVVFAVVMTTIFRQNGLKNLAKSTTDDDFDLEGGWEQLYGSPIDESITVMRTRVPFNTVRLLNDAGLLWNETDSKNLAKSTTDDDFDQEGGWEQLYGSPIDESITVVHTSNDAGLLWNETDSKNLAKSTTDDDFDQEGGWEQLYGSPIDESITVMRTRVPFNTVCLLNDAGLLWNETDSCIVPHYYPPRRFFSGSQLSSISEQA